jgi:hypothetical protein
MKFPLLLENNRSFSLLALDPALFYHLSPYTMKSVVSIINDLISSSNPYSQFNQDRFRETATFAHIIHLLSHVGNIYSSPSSSIPPSSLPKIHTSGQSSISPSVFFCTLLSLLPSLLGVVWLAPDIQLLCEFAISLLPSTSRRSDTLNEISSSSMTLYFDNWKTIQTSTFQAKSPPGVATTSSRFYYLNVLLIFCECLFANTTISSNIDLFVSIFANRILLLFHSLPPAIVFESLRILALMLLRRPSFSLQFGKAFGFQQLAFLLLPFALYPHVYTILFAMLLNNSEILVNSSLITASRFSFFSSIVSSFSSQNTPVNKPAEFTFSALFSPPNSLSSFPLPQIIHVILFLLEGLFILNCSLFLF